MDKTEFILLLSARREAAAREDDQYWRGVAYGYGQALRFSRKLDLLPPPVHLGQLTVRRLVDDMVISRSELQPGVSIKGTIPGTSLYVDIGWKK